MIVTRTDPEEGELVKTTLETGTAHESADDMQKEKAFEKVLIRFTLTIAVNKTPAPDTTLTITAEEDSHLVDNVEEPDIRDETDESNGCDAS